MWTKYGERQNISPYSVRMRKNTDQKKLGKRTLFMQRYTLILKAMKDLFMTNVLTFVWYTQVGSTDLFYKHSKVLIKNICLSTISVKEHWQLLIAEIYFYCFQRCIFIKVQAIKFPGDLTLKDFLINPF